jgi:hypothetical protein
MPKQPAPALAEEGEPPARPRTRRRGLVTAAFVLIAALVALTAAFGNRGSDPHGSTGSSGSAARAATPPTLAGPTAGVTGRQLALRVPRGWSRLRSAPDLTLPLSGAIAVAPRGASANRMVEFGVMKDGAASNTALLPAAFLGSIGQPAGTVPTRAAVQLPAQRLAAWRYANLRPAGTDRQLTVYSVPTTDGVATVACAASSRQAAAFQDQCAAIAGTLELVSGRPYPVGPSQTYASALNTAFGTLQQATTSQEAALEAAQTVSGQASAARALAGEYQTAAAQLAVLDLSPADRDANGQLVSALRRLGRAYQKAARAATGGDASTYRAASAAIPGAKARVNSALAGLRIAGYQPAAPAASKPGGGGSTPSSGDQLAARRPAAPQSDVGDSRSDDPSDDEGDSGEP